jgi:phosphoribosylformylglycinamidine synthase
MKIEEIKVGIIRIEGTNCEEESFHSFIRLGADADFVHLKQLSLGKKTIFDYHCLMIPGGFSSGDYVRAGAIFASRMKALLEKDLESFIDEGYPILGVCNGFQVLIELGLLPGIDGISDSPQACLAVNDSNRFECRPTFLIHENPCPLTSRIGRGEIRMMPSAHFEGKLLFPLEKKERYIEKLKENRQIVFKYVNPSSGEAEYPWNPNGSIENIAGICNPQGNVMGMMPHPERVFYPWQHPDWTRNPRKEGDGRAVFESILEYISKKF